MRGLHDSLKNPREGTFKSQEIVKNINIRRKDLLKKKEMKSSQLSNILKSLRSQNLISSEKSRHGLTNMGFVLSGILSED
jgi:5'(3')-deoxyribonucleotidase